MKKKFLTFFLCICFIIPAMFCLSACTQTPPDIQFKVADGYIQYYDGESWSNLIAVEDLKGEDGDDADVWTIGIDGYWYKNGIKQNHKAIGDVGTQGNGIKSITPSTDPTKTNATQTTYIITLDNESSYELIVKNGTNGDDADVWTIGNDGYWYKNNVKTDNKAIGEDGDEYTIGIDGYWYLNGEKTQYKAIGTDADVWTIGEDGYWYKNGVITEYKAIGVDATYTTYTITYDYGKASDLFESAKSSDTIKSTEWITTLPEIKDQYKESFIGWYIVGTNKQIENYDFIGGNVTLEARFNVDMTSASGLYQNGRYVMTWDDIKLQYVEAFNNKSIIGDEPNHSYLTALNGELVIDDEITSIGICAFIGCDSLTNIIIPNSVTSIGRLSFTDCIALTRIVIPKEVTRIDSYAFRGCCSLTSMVVEKGNTVYDSRNNCNAIIYTYWNELIAGCKNTIIPNSVKTIGDSAFSGCDELTEIILPQGLIEISANAFSDCCSLASVIIPNSVTEVGTFAFSGCDSLISISVPESVISIGDAAFANCNMLKSIIVSYGNTIYDSRNNCNAIIETNTNKLIAGCKNTIIPEDVKEIGAYAFAGCSSLTSIFIPNSVENIGIYAFDHSSLKNITIPSSVKSIGSGAFSVCSSLTNVVIEEGVENIGYSAFEYCRSLNSITIPSGVTSIGYGTFSGCSKLKEVIIDSNTISNGLSANSANGYLINYAETVYIKTGLTTGSSTYLTSNFTKQTTSDKDGYDMWLKK